jgi:lysozyme family protein
MDESTKKRLFDTVREIKGSALTQEDVNAVNAVLNGETAPVSSGTDLERALAVILPFEGGWSDHREDPGGATMKGITLATFRAWRKNPNATKAELRAITDAEVAQIYEKNYYRASGADAAPWPMSLMVLDCAINQGVRRAVEWSQAIIGVDVDGKPGDKTRRALAVTGRDEALKLADRREKHYRSLSTFPTFGRGWMNRLNHMRTIARS